MRGLCKTSCGCEIEFEPHEFSDGFVYYLPRNLDGKVHNCIFSEEPDFFNLDVDEDDEVLKEFCQKHKERLKISPAELVAIIASGPMDFVDLPMDLDFMDSIRMGNVLNLKKYVERELSIAPMPYLAHRSDFRYQLQDEQEIFETKATQEQIIGYTWIELPTDSGYQLEYLGILYELMIRLEDAKKCYDLQYECTGEPELLEKSNELDEKIQKQNETKASIENIPDKITPELLKNSIDETEKKIRQYIIALFSNDVNKIWKRLPHLGQTIHRIHEKEQESILIPNEKSDVERLSLGMLNKILKESKSKIHSNKNGKCSICGKTWNRGDYIYLGKYKVKNTENPICSDEDCFKKQGGLVAITPYALINNIYIITDARNVISHIRNYDKIMQQHVFKQAFDTCQIINNFIDDYLDKKNLI
jgi:hypothetical protein